MKRLVALDRQHVRHVPLFQPAPQVPVLTVDPRRHTPTRSVPGVTAVPWSSVRRSTGVVPAR
jgi:hypothetical protein